MYSVFTVASAILKLIIRRLAEESVSWPYRWDKPVGVLYLSDLSKRRCSLCNLTCGRMESERIKHQKTPGRWDIPDLSTRAKVVSPCLRPPLALPPIYAQDPVRGPARWRGKLPRSKDMHAFCCDWQPLWLLRCWNPSSSANNSAALLAF